MTKAMITGRPKKDESNYRCIVKHIRYSREEWEAVEAKINSLNLTFSEFIRRSSFSSKVYAKDIYFAKTLQDIRNNLAKIGANINTVAKYCNSSSATKNDMVKCREYALEMVAELDKLRGLL